MGAAGEGFAVALHHGFVVADYDEDHAGESGLLKQGAALEGGVGEGERLLGGDRGCPGEERCAEEEAC